MTWNDITIADYIQIKQVLDTDVEPLIKQGELLKLITKKEIDNLPLPKFIELAKKELAFLNQPPRKPSFKDVKEKYHVAGWDLELWGNISKITTAQYVDYTNIQKPLKTEIDAIAAYPKVLSVFLIPEGKKYNEGYDIVKLQDDIEQHMPITDAMAIAFFLSSYSRVFLQVFLRCFKKKVRKMKMDEDSKELVSTALQNMVSLMQ